MRTHPKGCQSVGTFPFQICSYYKFLEVLQFQIRFIGWNENTKKQQGNRLTGRKLLFNSCRWSHILFGAVKSKRPKTVQSNIADFQPSFSFKLEDVTPKSIITEEDSFLNCEQDLITKSLSPSKNNVGIFGENIIVFSTHVWLFVNMFRTSQTCVLITTHVHFGRCLTFTHHVWKTPNRLIYCHLGAFYPACLDFDTYVWKKAHMCGKGHTIM